MSDPINIHILKYIRINEDVKMKDITKYELLNLIIQSQKVNNSEEFKEELSAYLLENKFNLHINKI